ncbi:MAG: ABC transporter ATP-binding protein [Actinomycetota bacterium]|jgi:ABC-type branched-subunit amino acid transport system ATPase component|nr:ABC transporter ATP-binding protein [Actinomycetota bacterium]
MDEDLGTTSSTQRPPPYLRVHGVSAGYNRVPIVHDVSLQVGLGEVVLVMGPNGAGKSTLIKAITGELPAFSGRVELDGRDVTRLRGEERNLAGIGYVPQVRDVFGPLSVAENLEMGGYRLRKQALAERQEEIFDLFPQLLPLRRRLARTLSGGERKMLAIGRALMAQPRLMVLDEPTAGLAPTIARSVLRDIVTRLAESGRALLLIEQRVSLGLEVSSWGYVMTDGRVRLEEPCTDLRDRPDLATLFLGQGGVRLAGAGRGEQAGVPGAAGGGA